MADIWPAQPRAVAQAMQRRELLTLVAMCLGVMMTFLLITATVSALSAVQADLHVSPSALIWIPSAYTLVVASLVLSAGTLGNLYGRKRMFCVGVVVARFDIPPPGPGAASPRRRYGLPPHPRGPQPAAARGRRVTKAQLARLNSPIGLDLSAHTPEETAISITAEIIAHSNRATGLPLSRGTGPIHRSGPTSPLPPQPARTAA